MNLIDHITDLMEGFALDEILDAMADVCLENINAKDSQDENEFRAKHARLLRKLANKIKEQNYD